MKYKVLLLLGLLIGCTSIEKPKVDYNKGWIIEKDGTRHFYGNEEVVLNKEIRCLIHGVDEVIKLKKSLTSKEQK
tara:strand:- start:664 stop:888 length:225 start_codon:yes stop_codon:yes gene_type:complete